MGDYRILFGLGIPNQRSFFISPSPFTLKNMFAYLVQLYSSIEIV
jgi:hypothetical protein